jgi:hypothetical protein
MQMRMLARAFQTREVIDTTIVPEEVNNNNNNNNNNYRPTPSMLCC